MFYLHLPSQEIYGNINPVTAAYISSLPFPRVFQHRWGFYLHSVIPTCSMSLSALHHGQYIVLICPSPVGLFNFVANTLLPQPGHWNVRMQNFLLFLISFSSCFPHFPNTKGMKGKPLQAAWSRCRRQIHWYTTFLTSLHRLCSFWPILFHMGQFWITSPALCHSEKIPLFKRGHQGECCCNCPHDFFFCHNFHFLSICDIIPLSKIKEKWYEFFKHDKRY